MLHHGFPEYLFMSTSIIVNVTQTHSTIFHKRTVAKLVTNAIKENSIRVGGYDVKRSDHITIKRVNIDISKCWLFVIRKGGGGGVY